MPNPTGAVLLASIIAPLLSAQDDGDRPVAINTAVATPRTSEDDASIRAALGAIQGLQEEDGGFPGETTAARIATTGRVLLVLGFDGTTVAEGRYVEMARGATAFLLEQIDAETGCMGPADAPLGSSQVLGIAGLNMAFQVSGVKIVHAPLIKTVGWLTAARPEDGVWGGEEARVDVVGPATALQAVLLDLDYAGVEGDTDAAAAGLDWLIAAAGKGESRDELHAACYALDVAGTLARQLESDVSERLEGILLAAPTPSSDEELDSETELVVAWGAGWLDGRRMVEFLRPREARIRSRIRASIDAAKDGESPLDARELASLVSALHMISSRVWVKPS